MNLENIRTTLDLFFGDWGLLLYLSGIVLFLLFLPKRGRRFWIPYLVLCALFFLNPVTAWVISRMGGSYGEDVYYRFLWMVPYLFFLAGGIVLAWTALFRRLQVGEMLFMPIALLLLFLGLGSISGGTYLNREALDMPHNESLLEDEIVKIDGIIRADAEKKGIQYPSFVADDYLTRNLSIVSDTLVMALDRNNILHYDYFSTKKTGGPRFLQSVMEGKKAHSKRINKYLRTADIDYVITRREFKMTSFYKNCSLKRIGRTKNYDIFRNKRRVLKVYDEKNHLVEKTYANSKGEPKVRSPLRYATVRYTYDGGGNITSEQYFDAEGNPAILEDGSSGCLLEYTRYHKVGRRTYVDAEGNPILTTGGYASITYTYEGKKVTEKHYYDLDGMEVKPAKS